MRRIEFPLDKAVLAASLKLSPRIRALPAVLLRFVSSSTGRDDEKTIGLSVEPMRGWWDLIASLVRRIGEKLEKLGFEIFSILIYMSSIFISIHSICMNYTDKKNI